MGKQSTLLERAADRTTDAVDVAREATKEFVENTARPAVSDAKAKAAPIVAAGAALAAERAAAAKQVAEAKAYELTGHPKPRKRRGRTLVRVLLLGGLAAVGVAVARKLMGGGSQAWSTPSSSSYPAPATPTGTSPVTPVEPLTSEDPGESPTTPPVNGS